MNEPGGDRLRLYDSAELEAVIERMTARAAGLLAAADDPLLLGIQRRGEPLAEMLQHRLSQRHRMDVPRYGLKLKRYADNLAVLHPETLLSENVTLAERSLAGATVLVVDDVLYQGHSLVRVLNYLAGRGPRAIHAAVLVDRCVAQFPVRASIVGVRLQVGPRDVVECCVPPYEEAFAIDVVRRAG